MASCPPGSDACRPPAVRTHPPVITKGPSGELIAKFRGWSFVSRKAPIADSSRRAAAAAPLPDMYFDENCLTIHSEDGHGISFCAASALATCKKVTQTWYGKPLKVAGSLAWQSSQGTEGLKAVAESQQDCDHDWTFSCKYAGDLVNAEPHASDAPLPMGQLRLQDPVLHYAEVHLFEDELSDHGLAQLRVRLRVMPDYFFILLRFWLRVDGLLYRAHDVRLYHSFGSRQFIREIVCCESSHDEFVAALPPEKRANPLPLLVNSDEVAPLLVQKEKLGDAIVF